MEPTLPAKVVDTIGAGDSFNAGFLAKLSELGMVDKAGIANANARNIATSIALCHQNCGDYSITRWRKSANIAQKSNSFTLLCVVLFAYQRNVNIFYQR